MSNNAGQRTPRTRAAKEAQGAGGTTTWIPQDQSVDPSYRPTTTAGPITTCSGGGSSCVLSKLIQLPAPPLSRHQLKKLEEHRYSSAGHSLLEPFMQHYWEWLVARVPAWIAPNLITIVGLATNILTTLVLVYYCPTATEQTAPTIAAEATPRWVLHFLVVDLFQPSYRGGVAVNFRDRGG